MRSLVFEGNTWSNYEKLRESDKKLHKNLCKILKEILRNDPRYGIGKQNLLNIIYLVYGRGGYHKKIELFINLMINISTSSLSVVIMTPSRFENILRKILVD